MEDKKSSFYFGRRNMKKRISDEDEVKLYHKFCDIAKLCRKYFYERQHMPSDWWTVDEYVDSVTSKSKELKELYKNIRNNMKEKS